MRSRSLPLAGLLAGVFACQPSAVSPAGASAPAGTTPDTISSSAPGGAPASSAGVVQDDLAVSAGATLPQQELECVTGPDPEIDKESPWSKETGQRLDRLLPRLSPCTRGLPSGETELTLRLVYGPDGSSISQHVVHSSPAGCEVASCLLRELTQVPSPKLLIERASYDIALVLERGSARRADDPPDVIASAADDSGGGSCVDPAITALSRAKIKEVVSTSYTDLKTCYGQALMRDHSATGNVTVEFVIGQAGKVARAQVRDATLPDCGAIQCMLAEFRELQFPAPVGRSLRIIYPINYVIEQEPVTLR
ncbi:MAG: AgmX/PglI C-terminal domain-containing protein [Deltaproteobacteria bacterium]